MYAIKITDKKRGGVGTAKNWAEKTGGEYFWGKIRNRSICSLFWAFLSSKHIGIVGTGLIGLPGGIDFVAFFWLNFLDNVGRQRYTTDNVLT